MCKLSLGIFTLLCTIFLAPFLAAAQTSNEFENLCAPVPDTEFDQGSSNPALEYSQELNIPINLLENGINPGFTAVSGIDQAQLMKSVAQFQAANNLPVTGRLDAQTLGRLNLPIPKVDAASSVVERTKPSK